MSYNNSAQVGYPRTVPTEEGFFKVIFTCPYNMFLSYTVHKNIFLKNTFPEEIITN